VTDERTHINRRIVLLALIPAIMGVTVIVRLFTLVVIDGPEIREQAGNLVIKEMRIPADRGNIYSSDQKLLATSMPVFDIYMDPISVTDDNWAEGIDALCKGLETLFPRKNAVAWKSYLTQARGNGNRYVFISKNVSYNTLLSLKKLPIFSLGKYKGGLIAEQKNYRKMPMNKIAERTIGYDKQTSSAGLEGSFTHILAGKDGYKMMQRIAQGNYKPLHDGYLIQPKDGQDIVTTIDTRIQDITHHALLRAVETFEADHGTAVVMEVKTGEIKAIANLGRNQKGYYYEKRNYAIWESTEPGSTFKLATLLALLEDGKADTNTIVDTRNGTWEIHGQTVRDANVSSGRAGYGKISLAEAFAKSSNVGISQLVNELYGKDPEKFVDRLYKFGLHKPLNTEIKGEGKPYIPHPSDGKWSGITLPWMDIGYEPSFTPLQILTLYNAVANNGVMVKPYLVKEIREHGRSVKKIEPTVLNPSLCSHGTLKKTQALLKKVVDEGTARNIKSPNYQMAGKTGTCRLEYWKTHEAPKYQASFAGYFPADEPMYSVIVVINSPKPYLGFYGNVVAAPVAKNIADNLYTEIPVNVVPQDNKQAVQAINTEEILNRLSREKLPDFTGWPGHEAVALLENAGYKTSITGNGRVSAQYPETGSRVRPGATIQLNLR
jgi:cell division protein FtsI (penicillin-binding protein 3)